MRILIAPDSFKGSLSAVEAADALRQGTAKIFPQAAFDILPIADGGEGTVAALVAATQGKFFSSEARGPLGAPVTATWGLLGDGHSAVVEMAAASGLPLVPEGERNVLTSCTYGTGEVLAAALEKLHASSSGAKRPRLFFGIGGSATNDAGAGALRALGVILHTAKGEELAPGGAALSSLARIDASNIHPLLAKTDIYIACDVNNPLCGPLGASAVFGPQKGATPEHVAELDAALAHFAHIAGKATGKDVALLPGAGAAGGFGAGMLFFTNATLCSGVSLVLEFTDFAARAAAADLVITGEGHTDFQTAHGKAPAGVAKEAKKHKKPVICISGGLGCGYTDIYPAGADAAMSSICSVMTLEECIRNAAPMLTDAAERACRLVKIGMELGG